MANPRKTVADYMLNGGVEGRSFVDEDGIVYQIQGFSEVTDPIHGNESLGWGIKCINLGRNSSDFPRMVNSIFRDSEATPEEVQRARESSLEQTESSGDPCKNCAERLTGVAGESCLGCPYKKN